MTDETDYSAIGEVIATAIQAVYALKNHTHSAYVNPTIVDNLNSTSTTSALSANQGKVLADLMGDVVSILMGTGGS